MNWVQLTTAVKRGYSPDSNRKSPPRKFSATRAVPNCNPMLLGGFCGTVRPQETAPRRFPVFPPQKTAVKQREARWGGGGWTAGGGVNMGTGFGGDCPAPNRGKALGGHTRGYMPLLPLTLQAQSCPAEGGCVSGSGDSAAECRLLGPSATCAPLLCAGRPPVFYSVKQ